MRIVEIREAKAALGGGIRNAAVDFSHMTTSVVAVMSDVMRGGRPVTGLGFAAPGRYAQGGILRERFIPRVLAAAPESLLDDDGALSPEAAWRAAMADEKPGGHGDRAVALAALDVAMWDLAGKLAERPLWSIFAERANNGAADRHVAVYPGGGYTRPARGLRRCATKYAAISTRDTARSRSRSAARLSRKTCGRVETAVRAVGDGARVAVDANGALDRTRALAYAEALAPFGLMWFEEPQSRSTMRFTRSSPPPMRRRWRPGNVSCRSPTRGIWRVTPACARLATGSRSTRRCVTGRPNICGSWRCSTHMAGRGGGTRRMAATKSASRWPPGCNWAGANPIRGVFQPFGGFADDERVEDGKVRVSDAPGLGIERKAALHARLRDLLGL